MNRPPIAPILMQHGATHVPTGHTGWRAMHCPYHNDTDASAAINGTTQRFACHACGVNGDAYDLIQHHDNVTFTQARAALGETHTHARRTRTPRVPAYTGRY